MRKKINTDKIFNFFVYLILIAITVVMLYPLYFTVIASISDPDSLVSGEVLLWPVGFQLDGYLEVMKEDRIWLGYRNTIINTVCGTLFNLLLTIPAAFALSRKRMRFHGLFTIYFVFTMFFGGGLLPFYLQVKSMGLYDKPYTLIVLGGLSVYNVIVTRTFFTNSIPESLYEAAEIDGGSEFDNFFRIALPLSKAIIAVMALYYAVGRWNEYFGALVYLSDRDYQPLQMVLRNILLEGQMNLAALDSSLMSKEQEAFLIQRAKLVESMKYCIIFIASLPVLVAYPFVQKYFVKGVMIGSIKG